MTYKIVPDMTYNVFGGTLNLAQSISQQTTTICFSQQFGSPMCLVVEAVNCSIFIIISHSSSHVMVL